MAYNKDMQEDKEGVFDACDTVSMPAGDDRDDRDDDGRPRR